MTTDKHLSADDLERGAEHILAAPSKVGHLKLIVKRPDVDQLFLDMDLSDDNLPLGRKLRWGKQSSKSPNRRTPVARSLPIDSAWTR
ncbi:MAG: hypothetical protein E2O37_09125 [Proteobacteria bacterium]|nr:MAG: hypothetical protein E2O37_09125 [Pseudomonadota bacterium]